MDDGMICADMGEPILEAKQIPFDGDGDLLNYSLAVNDAILKTAVLSFGNPHAVIEVEDLDSLPIDDLGKAIQQHPSFPQSVNVEFMHCISRSEVAIRIYERGVGETQACGSGACAVAFVATELGLVDHNVQITMSGGQLFAQRKGERIMLTGPAEYIKKECVVSI